MPEVASRSHLTQLRPLIAHTLASAALDVREIDGFAATAGPGLATSLMLGLSAAKVSPPAFASLSSRSTISRDICFRHFSARKCEPCVALIVSGGHTLLVEICGCGRYSLLGQTRDDAAGEAFDKVGETAAAALSRRAGDRPAGAQRAIRAGIDFPRSMLGSGDCAFSFSGLKTAVRYLLPKLDLTVDGCLNDVCASFQEAVVEVLVRKTVARGA